MSLNESNYVYKRGGCYVQKSLSWAVYSSSSLCLSLSLSLTHTHTHTHTLLLRWFDKQSGLLPTHNYCYFRVNSSLPINSLLMIPSRDTSHLHYTEHINSDFQHATYGWSNPTKFCAPVLHAKREQRTMARSPYKKRSRNNSAGWDKYLSMLFLPLHQFL
jgi:hypothetical protein